MIRVLLIVCALSGSALAQDADNSAPSFEVVERYLEDLGLDELRAQYLEDQLDAMGGSQRVSVARRLADLYAKMLREAPDDTARGRLERRAASLLAAIPQAESDELRLSLARANFERAEAVLERWRLRAVDADEARGAIRSMSSLARVFDALGVEAHQRITRLESREERARDADLPMIEARLETALERRSSAFYLAGWAHRYQAEFADDRAAARQSRVSFGWLLNAPTGDPPSLERVPEGFASLPHIARAMLCVAYTYAITGEDRESDAWHRAVEETEGLVSEVRDQLPVRRLVALCGMERWGEARTVLDATPVNDPQRTLMSRLAAALAGAAVEVAPNAPAPRALRDAGLAGLVASGELGQAVEVTESFSVTTMPTGGFVGGLVRSVVRYQRLREDHRAISDGDRPAQDQEIVQRYAALARDLNGVILSAESEGFAIARPAALFVLGMCHYYSREFERASAVFEKASDEGRGTTVDADALWMAIVTHDASKATNDASAQRRNTLVDRFLNDHPDDPRVSRLTMRRALEREDDPERSIELLLAVAPEDPAYLGARRQAARLAYAQASAASGPVQAFRVRRYLTIAEPLLALDRRRAAEDPQAAGRATLTARRILGMALRLDTPDIARAERAFDAIDSMAQRSMISTARFEAELLFRRAEYALARDEVAEAEGYLSDLAALDPDLAMQGDRLVWRQALRSWRRTRDRDGNDARREDAAQRVVRIGDRLIDAMSTPEEALSDDANASVYRAVARASSDVWRWAYDEGARKRAQELFGALMSHGAESREIIEGFVEMARSGADFRAALDAQRRLVSGLEAGTRPWFEARTLQLELLREVDRVRAKDALRQHIALYPDLAPEPWRTRLSDLARELNVVIEDAG